MVRVAALLLVFAPPAQADERFNCPEPEGEVQIDAFVITNAWPSHVDKLLPHPFTVDYCCSVGGAGQFEDCTFAVREEMTGRQTQMIQSAMPRVMRGVVSDVPNQKCVAGKIVFRFGKEANSSEPAPDEPAAERVIPH